MFTFMMVSFAGITVYMLAAAGFITAKGIINVKNAVEAGGKTFTVADIFANAIFRSVPPSRSTDRAEPGAEISCCPFWLRMDCT